MGAAVAVAPLPLVAEGRRTVPATLAPASADAHAIPRVDGPVATAAGLSPHALPAPWRVDQRNEDPHLVAYPKRGSTLLNPLEREHKLPRSKEDDSHCP